MKLPEPTADVESSVVGTEKRYKFTALRRIEQGIHSVYTEAQLKQAVRDALEAAAQVCELFDATDPKYLAVEIRNMAKEIV